MSSFKMTKCGSPATAGICRILSFYVSKLISLFQTIPYYMGYFFIQFISSSMVVNASPVTVSAQP